MEEGTKQKKKLLITFLLGRRKVLIQSRFVEDSTFNVLNPCNCLFCSPGVSTNSFLL